VAMHVGLGFASCGVAQDAGFEHGGWHAVGFWQKLLSPAGAS